jgi:hypothetical protein
MKYAIVVSIALCVGLSSITDASPRVRRGSNAVVKARAAERPKRPRTRLRTTPRKRLGKAMGKRTPALKSAKSLRSDRAKRDIAEHINDFLNIRYGRKEVKASDVRVSLRPARTAHGMSYKIRYKVRADGIRYRGTAHTSAVTRSTVVDSIDPVM